jgi:phosphotransferase system  glucose/maltose/N-acetylglucosamine-specific IIC component
MATYMKKFMFGVAVLLIGLGFMVTGAIGAHAQGVGSSAAPTSLSPSDAATLKQGLDILKKTLDLLAIKIQRSPAPIENALAINSELNGLKSSLTAINSTLIAMSQIPSENIALGPSEEGSVTAVNNQLASVSSTFHWNYVTWPVIVVIAAIVLTLVIRRKIAGKKLIVIKENIKEMKEKSA